MYLPDGRVRKLRQSVEDFGCAHELTFSCYRRQPFLLATRTRHWLVAALEAARQQHAFELWAYVIMPEHVHLLIVPRDPDYRIRCILQAIKQPVAQRAVHYLLKHNPESIKRLEDGRNRRNFWQRGGGFDRNVTTAATAWRIVNYIHENPVRRELVSRSIDWEWSSARWYAGEPGVPLAMDGFPPADR